MDVAQIWQSLSDIKIGALVAWCIVIIAIITATIRGIKNVYAFISKYKEMKELNERQSKMLEEHEKSFKDIKVSLDKISKSLDEQKIINLKYTRHIIVNACYEALIAGCIQIERLASIEEMYEEYVNVFNGNSYVCGLVKRVRSLPIIDSKEKIFDPKSTNNDVEKDSDSSGLEI